MSRFKHGGDLSELGRLREMSELISGYCQIGAWSLEDVVAVDMEKFFIKVVVERERSSLRIEPIILSSLSPRDGCLVFSLLRAIDIPVLASGAFLISFAVPRGAVDADNEDRATPERRERRLLSEGFGEGVRRALGLRVQIFLHDGLEGCSRASSGVQHADHRKELVGNLVGKRMDIPHLVGEFAPQGVLVGNGVVGEPEG